MASQVCRSCTRDLPLDAAHFAKPPGRHFYKDCKDCVRVKKQLEYRAAKSGQKPSKKAKTQEDDGSYAASPLGRAEAFLFPGVERLTPNQTEQAIAFCKRRLGIAP